MRVMSLCPWRNINERHYMSGEAFSWKALLPQKKQRLRQGKLDALKERELLEVWAFTLELLEHSVGCPLHSPMPHRWVSSS